MTQTDARHWLDLARGDLAAARVVAAASGLPSRVAVGMAHHAAEKALKAAIAFLGSDPPRSHDLVALGHRVDASLRIDATDTQLRVLTDAHGRSRYPEPDDVGFDDEDVATLVSIAASVVREVEQALS